MNSLIHLCRSLPSLFILFLINLANAQVTVYTTIGSAANPEASAGCFTATACDGNVITPPVNPTPEQGLAQSVPVQLLSGGMTGLGNPVDAAFQGFSIELSVANQILGNDGNITNPIFLNLMANIVDRAGRVLVRVGGNSQETATVIPGGLPNDTAIEKIAKAFTPTLLLSPNLIYAMGNISQFLNVDWFLGVPFNDTVNPRTLLAEIAQDVLGDHLIGLQLGNEPDLYKTNGLRPTTYDQTTYFTEYGQVLGEYDNDTAMKNTSMWVGPSVCCGQDIGWTPETVYQTGWLQSYGPKMSYISAEHYPTNNCNGTGTPFDPNLQLTQYFMNHSAVIQLSAPYINSAQLANQMGKPFIMFETNTASCGGFSGLSDSFVSALWAVDYNLGMASSNISNALYHVGGASDYYNPFTPPPTNQSHFRQWTIGPTYMSAIVTAEAFSSSGKAQVIDLNFNNGDIFTAAYAIYESGTPQRMMFINYLTDPTGAANYTAYVSVGGNQTGQPPATPASVKVKYLLAPTIAEKWNITWGGQYFGGAPFASDGRIEGTEFIYEFACDTTNNVCPITVPAPGAALVYLSDQAQTETEPTGTVTFATSYTKGHASATLDPSVLATSNGRGGQSFNGLGSTSPGSSSGATRIGVGSAVTGACVLLGWFLGMRGQ